MVASRSLIQFNRFEVSPGLKLPASDSNRGADQAVGVFETDLLHSSSNRSLVANDFCVPTASVDSAAYRVLRESASFSPPPLARKPARLPINASTASVVSTGFTTNGGTWRTPSFPAHNAPFDP